MKFSTIRELKLQTTKVFKELSKEGSICVTRHGKPVAILERFTEDDFAKQFNALKRKTVQTAKHKGVRPQDIDRIIQEVRGS